MLTLESYFVAIIVGCVTSRCPVNLFKKCKEAFNKVFGMKKTLKLDFKIKINNFGH